MCLKADIGVECVDLKLYNDCIRLARLKFIWHKCIFLTLSLYPAMSWKRCTSWHSLRQPNSSFLPTGFPKIPIHCVPSQLGFLALHSSQRVSITFSLSYLTPFQFLSLLVACYFCPSIFHLHCLSLSQECDFSSSSFALLFKPCGFWTKTSTKEKFLFKECWMMRKPSTFIKFVMVSWGNFQMSFNRIIH